MDYGPKLLLEIFVVGIGLGFIGTPISYAFMRVWGKEKTIPFSRNIKVFGTLVFIGMAVHAICELTGVNAWYVKNSAATLLLAKK